MSCGAEENAGLLSRLGLNDNKAGMQNLDREKINQIIYEASKGSKYFENEKKKDKQVDMKIAEQRQKIASFSEKEIQAAEKEANVLLKRLEEKRDLSRTIVHIDMDAFFAAVETRDNLSLLNKPIAVGSTYMLSTSNYIARRFGVRAAMPGFIAKKLCPQLVIVPQNFSQYAAVSKEVKDILVKYDEHFCPISFDEAYLDITEHLNLRKTLPKNKRTVICRTCDRLDPHYCYCDPNKSDFESTENQDLQFVRDNEIPSTNQLCFQGQERADLMIRIEDPSLAKGQDVKMCRLCKREVPTYREEVFGVSAEEVVREMRRKIEQTTRLTASAGIAANTLLAKICSDKNKPNGQFSLPHITDVIKDFMTDLPIRKVPGIGKVTEKMLQAIDIVTCSQLYEQRALLHLLYSDISFKHFICVTLGIGSTHVESDGEKKSLSTEQTFFEISEPTQLYDKCLELCKILASDLQQDNLMGRTITLKIKTVDFDVKTRSQTLPRHTSDEVQIHNVARNILKAEIQSSMPKPFRLRLMGIRMSNLIPTSQYPKKDIIEYFMKKESSTSDTILLSEQEKINTKECQNKTRNQSKNTDASGECLKNDISESPGHYCPICERKCPKDLSLFNAHIDKCLLQQSGENDRKSKRISPTISDADFEDFLQFSTSKVPRRMKKHTKMTQKNLKTVFEETVAGNGTRNNFCIEKSSECKYENLSETENVLKQREDCKNICTEQNSSEIEHKEKDSVVLETSADSATLKENLSSGDIVEVKDLSSPVNKLINSEEVLVSNFEKTTPKSPTTDTSEVLELNYSNMEQITSKVHSIKVEPDGTGPVKICSKYVKSQHSKNSMKQAGCNNKERSSDCSSTDIYNASVLRQKQTNKSTPNNTETKLKYSQNKKVFKKTFNCNLLEYFSKSSVNSTKELKQCLGSDVSSKWSELTDVVAEKTDKSVLDDGTICSQQQQQQQEEEVDDSGQLKSEDVTDQQWRVVETGQGSSVVSDKVKKGVETGQGISLANDKLQMGVGTSKGMSLDNDKLQKGVETGQGMSLDSDKLQKGVETDQGMSLDSDKLQKGVYSVIGQTDSLTKLQKGVETGQGMSLDSDKLQMEVETGQGSSTYVSEQLQKVSDSGQLDSVTSNQPLASANTGQTYCTISQLHSTEPFPHSTENSTQSSEAMTELNNSCNSGDSPNNKNGSSCPPQFQGSTLNVTDCVNVESQFYTPGNTSRLPQETGFPAKEDSCQLPSHKRTMELVHQCPICNNDILLADMSTFNEHVDLCLNQATIRKILLEQGEELRSSAAHKRPAENTSPDVGKRKRSIKPDSTPRIDSYFFSV